MNISEREPCKICGSTEIDLIDGFYYCAECGTQDANIQETMIELAIVADQTTGLGVKKRLTVDPGRNKQQMSDGWYKWHSLNFLIHGLAEDLIECGASTSFKTKLLWVWTRYMKKYQTKADFGLETNKTEDAQDNEQKNEIPEIDSDSSSEEEEVQYKKNRFPKHYNSIHRISMLLIISFLYVSLNLDRSQIQLTHLMRFIKDGRVSIISWIKHVPKELRPKELKGCLIYKRSWLKYSIMRIRYLSIHLFKELDLGTPLVPNLRPMIEDYMKELCLPNELVPLVHSVIRYRAFEYLDVHLHKCKTMPSYELYVIAHILFVLKLCFGIDGEYETRISDAVDKINEMEDHPRSYNSEPTERLFSFQEWLKFILFRRSQLWAHTFLLGAPHSSDMDVYVAGEHQAVLPDQTCEKTLRTEIIWDLLNKIPSCQVNAIPKSEFPPTLTPYTDYTRIIVEHMQDPAIKRALTEDFTQYSIGYFLEDMFLVDPESENPQNLITGVNPSNFTITSKRFAMEGNPLKLNLDHKMVYVKDCDNHNWMTTLRPTVAHITTDKDTNENYCEISVRENERDDDDIRSVATVDINDLTTKNDASEFLFHLKDNNNITKDNEMLNPNSISEDGAALNDTKYETASDIQSVTTVDINEFSTLNEKKTKCETQRGEDKNSNDNKSHVIAEGSKAFDVSNVSDLQTDIDLEPIYKEEDLNIREEDEGVSIFDDNFEETKREIFYEDDIEDVPNEIETNEAHGAAHEAVFNGFGISSTEDRYDKETQEYYTRRDSDESSDDSVHITPENLDRNAAIKELVIHACRKMRVSLPGKYIIRKQRKVGISKPGKRRTYVAKGVIMELVNNLINEYNSKIEEDILFQMSNAVQSAIADFNQTKTEEPMEVDEPAVDNNTEENGPSEPNEVILEDTVSDSRIDEVVEDRYKLFDDESDGETHAQDLLPKKNPEFDEQTHDPSQLYIKPAEDVEPPELRLNSSLFKVIDDTLKEDVDRPPSPEQQDQSDEEENIPLNVFRELRLIKNTITQHTPVPYKRKTDFVPLIQSVPKTPYFYWMKQYSSHKVLTNASSFGRNRNERNFSRELKNFPDTFVTILKEFSDVVGYPPFNVYKSLLMVEHFLEHKYVKRWNPFTPTYFRHMQYAAQGTYSPAAHFRS